jgi:hypothetical protein
MTAFNFYGHQRQASAFAWHEAQAGHRVKLERVRGCWLVRVTYIN